ncbi:MAG: DMT family transporter [Alphaproteobacteria bacterium]|nr:DMT family transporter [Alphaproteobacteria bacterium]
MSEHPSTASALTVLLVALLAVSHGSIFIRVADAHPFVISAFRVGIAASVVVPLAFALRWRELRALDRRTLAYGMGAGCFLALHFITWVTSLQYTSIANSTVLVTLNPVWIAIVMTIATRARPSNMVITSVGLSVAGSIIIGCGSAGAGAGEGSNALFGDGLALMGGMCAAGYLMLGKLVRQAGVSLLSYVAICYGVAATLLWVLVLAMDLPITGLSNETYAAMIAMALVSQVIGHSGYNWSLKVFNPGFIAVCLLGEPILASTFGLIYFGEAIPLATLAGAPIIMTGIYLRARAELR